MIDIWLWFFTCFNLFLAAKCSIPNEKLCVNVACTEPISRAQGSVKYISPSRELLSFNRGKEIIITSKSKNKQGYWGAVIDGKSGYVPSHLIKETQVFQSTDKLITVPTEAVNSNGRIEGNLNGNELPQKSNNLNQINALPLASENPLKPVLPESIIHSKQEFEKSLVADKGNANENLSDKLHNADLSLLSDFKENKNDLSPTKVYSVIEGTTVYMEGNEEEITPSPTLDRKTTLFTSLIKELNLKMSPENHAEEKNLEKENQIKAEFFPTNFQINLDTLQNKEKTILENESGRSNGGNVQNEKKDPVEDVKIHTKDIKNKDVGDDDDSDGDVEDGDVDDDNDDDNDDDDDDDTNADADSGGNKNVKIENISLNESDRTEKNIVENKKVITNGFDGDFPDKHPAQEESTQSNLINSGNLLTATNSLKSNEIDDSRTETILVLKEKIDASQKEGLEVYSAADEKNAQVDMEDGISHILSVPPQVQQDNLKTELPNVQLEGYNSENVINESTQDFTKTYTSNLTNDNITMSEKSVSADKNIPQDNMMEKSNPKEQEPETNTPETNLDRIKETNEDKSSAIASVELMDEKVKQQNLNDENSELVKDSTPTPTPKSHVNEISEEIAYQHEPVDESKGIFSWLTSFFSNLISSEKERAEENVVSEKNLPNTDGIQHEWIEKGGVFDESFKNNPLSESCENSDLDSGCSEVTKDESWLFWKLSLSSGLPASSNTLLYLIVTAVTVLLFTLGHNFIEKKGKTGPLIAKINKLEQELLVTSKECLLLKDEVRSAKEKVILYENSANDELVLSLQKELEESKKIRSELESSIEILQQELDAATEAGLDLNKMLSEVLTQKGGSETLLKSVENLQAQLDSQQKVIDEMTKKLGIKNQENEALQAALQSATEKADGLEDQMNDIKHNLNLHFKEKEDLTRNLNSQISELQSRVNQLNESKEKEVSIAQKNMEEFQKKFKEATQALTVKQEELKALKESIKQIKTKGNTNLERLFDVSRIKAELIKEEKENQELAKKLELEVSSKKVLEDQLKLLNNEVKALKKNYDDAEQKRDEAEKRLEVLSTYFKEKETQLQKELGLQEALWAQKMGDEKTVNNIIKSLQVEVDSYKSQNETLKKEILDQERGLKNQIAVLEQKAHENWVAARQAERKLEEIKQETAQLRNRLTLMEKSVNNDVEGKANHRISEELNGVEANSPILHDTSSPLLFPPLPMDPSNSTLLPPGFMPHPMFMPPPLGGFIPPPPFLPGDRRPPPLGRMSSPPLNSRFSPPPLPDYSFERMPSPPLSPSTRNFRSPNEADRDREHLRHRTPPYPPMLPKKWDDGREIPGFIPISSPRDPRRDQKGSNVSSGHSSSDSLDKSSRNSGRV